MGTIEVLVMLAMVAFNSVFAAYELALTSVSVAQLKLFANENRRGAKAALYMKENVEASLAAIQIGITMFGAIAAATGGVGAQEGFAPWLRQRYGLSESVAEIAAVATVVLPLTALTITFGELVPKIFALRNKEWVCLRCSPFMRWFTLCVWPAVWLFEAVVTAITDWGQSKLDGAATPIRSDAVELQELRAVASLARMSRLIGAGEERIIHGAARLASGKIRDIALPAAEISMLDVHASLADSLVASHLDMHTRFPVTERHGDPQAIVGYVNVKDLVAVMHLSPTNPSLRAIVRPIADLLEDESIANCLERLLRDNAHIALVRDRKHSVVGMVTLEDIVEELLGDIKDEYDRLPMHVVRSGSAWIVGGGIPLARLRSQTELDLTSDVDSAGAATLNDWVVAHLGRPDRAVRGGDVVVRSGVRVVVRKVRRKSVLEAQVSRQ